MIIQFRRKKQYRKKFNEILESKGGFLSAHWDGTSETEDKIRQRMEKAAKELAFAEEFDHILVNDNLLDAFKKAEELVKQFLS